MENQKYTLGIKIYTDGDFIINDITKISLDYYPDYETYFLVKSWDNFNYAKYSSISILAFIKENISSSNYHEYIIENFKRKIDIFAKEILDMNEEEFYKKKKHIYSNINGNQTLNLEFTSFKLAYDLRTFALNDRLQDFCDTIKNTKSTWFSEDLEYILNNILEGKNYNDATISLPYTPGYSGDLKDIKKAQESVYKLETEKLFQNMIKNNKGDE